MASRFWVGGGSSTNWDATANTNWAATSGGAGNQTVPGSGDDVFFDSNSGVGTSVLNAGFAGTINSIDCTGYAGTLQMDRILTIGGSSVVAKFVSGMTVSGSSKSITFPKTAGGVTFTSGGKTFGTLTCGANAATAGGTITFADNLTCATIFSGDMSLDFTNRTVNLTSQLTNQGGSANITITMSGCTLNLTGTGNVWFPNSGITIVVNTSSTINQSGTNSIFNGKGYTYNDLVLSGQTQQVSATVLNGNTFRNLTITGSASGNFGAYIFSSGVTQTVTGTFTVTGNSATTMARVLGQQIGSAATISAAAVSITNAIFRDITASGAAAPFTGTLLGDGKGNTSITFDSPLTLYWFKDTGNWNDSTKWFTATNGGGSAGRIPLPQDAIVFDSNSFSAGSKTVTCDLTSQTCASITFSGVTNTPAFSLNNKWLEVHGNVTFVSGMTVSQGQLSFFNRSAAVWTTADQSMGNTTYGILCPSTTVTLVGQIVAGTSSVLSVVIGTLDTAGYAVSVGSFNRGTASAFYSGTNPAMLVAGLTTSGSTVTFTATSGNVWNTSSATNFTVTNTTGLLKFNGTGAGGKTLFFAGSAGGPLSFGKLQITGAGSGTWTLTGDAIFDDFKCDVSVAVTLSFQNGKTFQLNTFTVNGAGGGTLITINSQSAGNFFTLTGLTPTNVICDSLSIKDSHAGGTGVNWFATNSTNVSGNTGWIFCKAISTPSPATQGQTATRDGSTITSSRSATQGQTSSRQVTITGAAKSATQGQTSTRQTTVTANRSATQGQTASRGPSVITAIRSAISTCVTFIQRTLTITRSTTQHVIVLAPPRVVSFISERNNAPSFTATRNNAPSLIAERNNAPTFTSSNG